MSRAVTIEVVRARAMHVRTIARRMRQADRDEVFAASGHTPFEALALSLRKSSRAYTGLVDGQPVVMFGVADINVLCGIGAPWLLGTDEVEQISLRFLRLSRRWRRQLFRGYSVLRNFVDVHNTVSVRWLRWLGATFSDPVSFNGYDFRLFEMRAD